MNVNVRICGDFKLATSICVPEEREAEFNEYNTIDELLDFESELKVLADIIEKRDYTLGTDYRFRQIMDVISFQLLCSYKESLIESKKQGKKIISEPLFDEDDMPDFFQSGFDPGFKPTDVFNTFNLEPTTESFSKLLAELRNTVGHGTCNYNFLTGLISLNSNGLKGEIPLKQLLALMKMHFNDNSRRVMDDSFSIPLLVDEIPSLGFYGNENFCLTNENELEQYLDNLYVVDVHVNNTSDKKADITYGEIRDVLTNIKICCSTPIPTADRINNLKSVFLNFGEKLRKLGVEINCDISKLKEDEERYKRVRSDVNIAGETFFEEGFEQKDFIINSLNDDKNNIKLLNNFLSSVVTLYFRTPNITLDASDVDPSLTSESEFNEFLKVRRKKHFYKSNDYVLCLFEAFVFCYYGLCCKLFKDGYFGLDLDNFDIEPDYIYSHINNKIAKLKNRKSNELIVLNGQVDKGDNEKANNTRTRIVKIDDELEQYQTLLEMPLDDMLSSDIVNTYIYESIRNAVVHQGCRMSDDKEKIIIEDIDYNNDNVCTFAATVDKQVVFNMIRESCVASLLGALNEDYLRIRGELLAYFKPVVDAVFESDNEFLKQYREDVQKNEPHKAIRP